MRILEFKPGKPEGANCGRCRKIRFREASKPSGTPGKGTGNLPGAHSYAVGRILDSFRNPYTVETNPYMSGRNPYGGLPINPLDDQSLREEFLNPPLLFFDVRLPDPDGNRTVRRRIRTRARKSVRKFLRCAIQAVGKAVSRRTEPN